MSPRHPNAREHELMGIPVERDTRDPDLERREKDLAVLAKLPEGRRVLAWLMFKDRVMGFRGNSQDAYTLGRRDVGEEFESYLKGILPRKLFVEIVYPEEGAQ